MNRDVRRITYGAMYIALVGLLLFINQQTAMIFDVYIYWFLSLPILLYTYEYDYKNGLGVAFGMGFFCFIFGTPMTWVLGNTAILIGLVYGYGLRRKWSMAKLCVATFIFTLIAYLCTTYFFAEFFGYDLAGDLSFVDGLLNALPVALPIQAYQLVLMSLILLSALEAVMLNVLAFLILPRFKIYALKVQSITNLVLPKWSGYLGVGIYLLFNLTIQSTMFSESLKSVIMILYLLVSILFIFYGYLQIIKLLRANNLKNLVVLAFIGMFMPIINNIYAIFGMLEAINPKK